MIMRRPLAFLVVLCTLALPVSADLPDVAPPGNLQQQRAPLPHRARPTPSDGRNAAKAGGEDPAPSKLDILMKSLADPNRPVRGTPADELRRMKSFAALSRDEQNRVIPELLGLLSNATELSTRGDRPPSPVWRVYHRVAMALATVAQVHLGQFPLREQGPMTPAERDNDRRAAEALRQRWRAWWAEAKPLDEIGRTKLSRRLRGSYYDTAKEDVFWANVGFARAQKDPTPLPQLAQWLVGARAEQRPASIRIVTVYVELCRAPDAPPEALLPLLAYVKASNPDKTVPKTPSPGGNLWWTRNVASYLRQLTGTGGDFWENLQVEVGKGDHKQTVTIRRVRDEAIAAWEKVIRERIEAARTPADENPGGDEPTAPKPQADPDGD